MNEADTLRDADLRVSLKVIGPKGQHQERSLCIGEALTVGRSASAADVVLEDSFVSRSHLEVRVEPRGVVVTDLSSNGSYRGQEKLPPKVPVDLGWGELVRVGRSTVRVDLADPRRAPRGGANELDPPSLPAHEFELLGVLGVGGAGRVWAAFHKGLKRLVAIKELRTDFQPDSEDLLRFQREATVGSRLRNPNVVELLECRMAEGRPLMIMEYVSGSTLAARLEHGPLPIPLALGIAEDVAEALRAIGELGVVHRDVKPSNVLLGADGVAKLADLGIAKVRDGRDLTQTGFRMGSLQYLAPEQAGSSRDVDVRTDLYSLGATAYAMLTGRPPFLFEGVKGLLARLAIIAHDSPLDVTSLRADCPEEVATLVHELLEKDPADRPSSAEEVRDRLRVLRERLYPGQGGRLKSASGARTGR